MKLSILDKFKSVDIYYLLLSLYVEIFFISNRFILGGKKWILREENKKQRAVE